MQVHFEGFMNEKLNNLQKLNKNNRYAKGLMSKLRNESANMTFSIAPKYL